MRICKECNNSFPDRVVIDGKSKLLKSRSYCLNCSPWGERNGYSLRKKKTAVSKALTKICEICKREYPTNKNNVCSSCRTLYTQTIPNSNSFRCLKIIFGSPRVFVDVPRTKLIEHILNEKKIITAYWDDRLKLWKEGSIVRLTTDDFIRIDSHDIKEDFLGV